MELIDSTLSSLANCCEKGSLSKLIIKSVRNGLNFVKGDHRNRLNECYSDVITSLLRPKIYMLCLTQSFFFFSSCVYN